MSNVARDVAGMISLYMESPTPSFTEYKNEAKTILSAYCLGQGPRRAAQRLLSWDCVDNGIPEQDISEVSRERSEPFLKMAVVGYFFLEGVQ